ncbi:dUTP diphosphatase [Bacillus phage 0105phi7-2]|uniref:dUTP diphosphatase n=1 Tax=Bacillus phage 0105phi7-2 TaxID=3025408 RepID=A0AAF0BTK0_9CAUD|nr:dUTP diphosphatase [Bacillus phage 0105phi7-2]WCS66612.1 dUTP diphosphatase [Bacillus phage 0105phi7-2]
MNLRVKIKRMKDVELPKYARKFDAGFDLVAAEDVVIKPGETKVVPTGLAFEIPPGYELQIRPRSGMSRETKLRVVLGTIDSGYRGEIGVIADNNFDLPYIVHAGMRIAQGVIAPVVTAHFVEVDKLSDSERGNYGFGSTGVK